MNFDLKAAREMAARNVPTIDPYSHPATVLSLACDEVERLQAENQKLWIDKTTANADLHTTKSTLKTLGQSFRELNQSAIEKNKRIAELESENENLREWGISNASDAAREKVKTEKQLAALKKLGQAKRERGKALVEERAQWNAICRDVGADPSDRYCTGEGDDGYPEAREQLRREGKI